MRVVYSPLHAMHDPSVELESSAAHSPRENVRRAEIIREALAADPAFSFVTPREFGTAPITAVHDAGLVTFLESAWERYQREVAVAREVVPDIFYRPSMRRDHPRAQPPEAVNPGLGWWCFETTTPLTQGTYTAARAAVGAALTATDLVIAGERAAYAICRPPGHHATSSLYGGYCFFNNAAIAARTLQASGMGKVTVLDVDYHHGNGTQEIFYDSPDVQYVSLHGDPARAYPYYTGFADETGSGAGRGTTLNVPLAARTDDDAYLGSLEPACAEIAAFAPDALVVSLGLDTFVTDPIADLALTTDGFAACGAVVARLGLPTVIVQEGGYDVDALGRNVHSWLSGFALGGDV